MVGESIEYDIDVIYGLILIACIYLCHYNRYFTDDPHVFYKRGETYEFEGTWHIDEVNLIDFEKLVREVGVKGEYTV